ncbi:MAG: DUF4041 domain-containing protein, partial [Acidobacteria bacterium]|nr:DUF4041 domain-containing protein [Acidobacteriota bacterium]
MSTADGKRFNPPPGWPSPPTGWTPPEGWQPDPAWPPPPPGWELWTSTDTTEDDDVQSELLASDERLEVGPVPTPPSTTEPLPAPPLIGSPPATAAESHDSVVEDLRNRLHVAESELTQLRRRLEDGLVELDDARVLQEVGIYNYHHPLENAEAYRERLKALQERLRQFVVDGEAILVSDMFTFNNSLAKGRKMTGDLSKLMLRAYNAEADSCVRSLRAGNTVTAKRRLEAAIASIAKLGSMMEMGVNPAYHELRIEELELTSDFLIKVQEEREHAREERERLREERKAEQELAAERERLEKERAHYINALEAIRAGGDETTSADLTAKLDELEAAIAQNDYRAANIRAGYVYVISNAGALGHNMVKIGMTRRLEPLDRIRELGDASVPFPFDVHALFFSEDAVTLEGELHRAFADRRVNRVNERREFFFATPHDVRVVLAAKLGNLLEFTEQPEATQYLQSQKYWPN